MCSACACACAHMFVYVLLYTRYCKFCEYVFRSPSLRTLAPCCDDLSMADNEHQKPELCHQEVDEKFVTMARDFREVCVSVQFVACRRIQTYSRLE